jgi:hypothetical protein
MKKKLRRPKMGELAIRPDARIGGLISSVRSIYTTIDLASSFTYLG